MRLLACIYSLAWCSPVLGNVEKAIFLGPEPVDIHNPQQQPNIDSLRLEVLSPLNTQLRRQLSASFPSSTSPKGTEAWFLLDRLRPKQRYEVRICWAATVRFLQIQILTLNCLLYLVDGKPVQYGRNRIIDLQSFPVLTIKVATNLIHSQHVHTIRNIQHSRLDHITCNLLRITSIRSHPGFFFWFPSAIG